MGSFWSSWNAKTPKLVWCRPMPPWRAPKVSLPTCAKAAAPKTLQAVRGMNDVLPDEAALWEHFEAAVADVDGLEASAIELERGGDSFTVDTVEELLEDDPERELFVIVGAALGAFLVIAAIVLAQFTSLERLAAGIFASTAVLGLIIGFAAQNTISNIIAGVLIAMMMARLAAQDARNKQRGDALYDQLSGRANRRLAIDRNDPIDVIGVAHAQHPGAEPAPYRPLCADLGGRRGVQRLHLGRHARDDDRPGDPRRARRPSGLQAAPEGDDQPDAGRA